VTSALFPVNWLRFSWNVGWTKMLDFLTVFVASMSVTFAENRLKQQQLWGYVVMSMFFPNAQLHAACFKIFFQLSSRALGNWLRGQKRCLFGNQSRQPQLEAKTTLDLRWRSCHGPTDHELPPSVPQPILDLFFFTGPSNLRARLRLDHPVLSGK
jgi:hypothetical protein